MQRLKRWLRIELADIQLRLSLWNPPPMRPLLQRLSQETRGLYRGSHDLRAVVQALALLGCLLLVDRMLGFPVALRTLYIAPVWLAALRGGKVGGIVMVLLTSLVVTGIDLSVDLIQPKAATILLNLGLRLVVLYGLLRFMDELESRLRHLSRLATHDPLTGVANRVALDDYGTRAVERANALKSKLSVAMIDCDRFKQLNDAYGHEYGDHVLKGIARILKRTIQHEGIVARNGGDEFVVVVPGRSREELTKLMQLALQRFTQAGEFAGRTAGFSFGVAAWGVDRKTFADILRAADEDMYSRKATRAVIGSPDDDLAEFGAQFVHLKGTAA